MFSPALSGEIGFQGAGGFCFAVYTPDLAPFNKELKALGIPEFSGSMLLYGGQGFGHVSEHLRVGGMGFGGSMRTQDFENGYAREATFSMSWGGILIEYWFLEALNCEFYAGGTLGWGAVALRLEKTASPVDWDDVWGNFQADSSMAENVSSEFQHSFFLMQPRLGIRYFLLDWLALSGTVEIPLLKLSSDGWELNGDNVYDAPELDLMQPFFQFSILLGG